MRNDDEKNRLPSWGDADNTGKFVYVMTAVLLFLVVSSFWN